MNLTLWMMCYVYLLAGLLVLASCFPAGLGRTIIALIIFAIGIHCAYRSQLGASPVPAVYETPSTTAT